jgi:hypothetical protein
MAFVTRANHGPGLGDGSGGTAGLLGAVVVVDVVDVVVGTAGFAGVSLSSSQRPLAATSAVPSAAPTAVRTPRGVLATAHKATRRTNTNSPTEIETIAQLVRRDPNTAAHPNIAGSAAIAALGYQPGGSLPSSALRLDSVKSAGRFTTQPFCTDFGP